MPTLAPKPVEPRQGVVVPLCGPSNLPVPGVRSWMLGWLVVVPLLPPPVESSGPTEEGRLEDGGLKGSVSTPPAAELGAPI
jgi:hypothetical protein